MRKLLSIVALSAVLASVSHADQTTSPSQAPHVTGVLAYNADNNLPVSKENVVAGKNTFLVVKADSNGIDAIKNSQTSTLLKTANGEEYIAIESVDDLKKINTSSDEKIDNKDPAFKNIYSAQFVDAKANLIQVNKLDTEADAIVIKGKKGFSIENKQHKFSAGKQLTMNARLRRGPGVR